MQKLQEQQKTEIRRLNKENNTLIKLQKESL